MLLCQPATDRQHFRVDIFIVHTDISQLYQSILKQLVHYGRPLSVSGRPCYILPMFFLFIIFFYGRLILRPWLTEVRESFTRSGP